MAERERVGREVPGTFDRHPQAHADPSHLADADVADALAAEDLYGGGRGFFDLFEHRLQARAPRCGFLLHEVHVELELARAHFQVVDALYVGGGFDQREARPFVATAQIG